MGSWAQAGGSAEQRPVGTWWASAPEEYWPADQETRDAIHKEWAAPYGDRRQELVFIGQDLPRQEMLGSLEECLLDQHEMAFEPAEWKARFTDPFPAWTQATND